jgi:8-oxo-dGTP diphosphatase
MVQVVAAILQSGGRILIGQRTPQQSHPLQWEFPGGKVEAGESPEQAVVRELQEELGIQASVITEITRYEYAYRGRNTILLIFLRIGNWTPEPQNLIFQDLRWEPVTALPSFDFVEGDRRFLEGLYTGEYAD